LEISRLRLTYPLAVELVAVELERPVVLEEDALDTRYAVRFGAVASRPFFLAVYQKSISVTKN